jgi:hypothetical protein
MENQSDKSWFFGWDSNIDAIALDHNGDLVFCDETLNVGKLDARGHLIWHTHLLIANFEGSSPEILFDNNNDILITNNISIITKLTSDGSFLWARHWESVECCDDPGLLDASIATDKQCNIYMTGRFQREVDINPGPEVLMFYSNDEPSINQLCKLSPDGEFLWAKDWQSGGRSSFDGIHINDQNQIIIVGDFLEPFDIDPDKSEHIISSGTDEMSNLFLKLDENGSLISYIYFDRLRYDFYRKVDWDNQSNSYYYGTGSAPNRPKGSTLSDQCITKVSPEGSILWKIEYETTQEYMIQRRFLSEDGYLYFLFDKRIDSQTKQKSSKPGKTNTSEYKLFEYNPDGSAGCAKSWISDGIYIKEIVADTEGFIYFSGSCGSNPEINIGSIHRLENPSRFFILKTPLDSL